MTSDSHSHPKVTDDQIIHAFTQSRGMVALSARSLGITRRALYYRLQQSEKLREALEDAREFALDNAESRLQKCIDREEAWAICFFLKTQGKSRGYIEKAEIDFAGRMDAKHSGTVGVALHELEQHPNWQEFARGQLDIPQPEAAETDDES